MSQPKICVVGASNLDLISYVPCLPQAGQTLHGTRFRVDYGGKGANQAVMAAKLGGLVTMVTKLGQDSFGQDILRNFQSWNINTDYLFFTDQASTGVAPIAVEESGANAIIIVMGANNLLTPAEIETVRPALATAQLLVCQLEIPLETTLAALRLARKENVVTILNPAPAQTELPEELYQLSDIFCPNEYETELLTGHSVKTEAEAEAAARILLRRGAKQIILTLGERGSLLVTADQTVHVPANSVKTVDTTGAGDTFVGTLAYFLADSQPLIEAMRRANHVAALSVQSSGTQASFPEATELPPEWLE